MGYWNYRLVRHREELPGDQEAELIEMHEAYYDSNGKVWAVTSAGIPVHGETKEIALECLEMMRKAFEKPILEFEGIPEEGAVAPGDPPNEFRDQK